MAKTTLTQPTLAEQYEVVIGVDTHKDFHVAVVLSPNGGRLAESITANQQGYSDLRSWALELGTKPIFAIEGTGSFGAGLCRELMASGFPVVEIKRTDRSIQPGHSLLAWPRSNQKAVITSLR